VAGRVAEGSVAALAPREAAPRTLTWRDGFVLSLTMPAALIATLGYSIGTLGAWHATLLWGVSTALALLANRAYTELAAMFPEKVGGIALYAAEGWRSRLALVGPVATFGYWFAWSSSLAVYSGIVGALVQAQWFPAETWSWSAGPVELTFARVVGAAVLVLVWAANILGLRPTMWLAYATAAMLLVPVAAFALLPFVTGDWSAASFTGSLDDAGQPWGGWKLALVWLYVMCWTSLGVETCATFTPEYAEPVRDATRALRAAALFSVAVFVLLPLGAAGAAGERTIAEDPVTFYGAAFDRMAGGGGDAIVALAIGSLLLVLVTCTADSARALYGIAADGMTVRELHRLNRFGMPGRAMTVDLVLNLALLFLLGSTLAIVAAGNLGYVLAHIFALSALLLLRRDRPAWPRPIRLARIEVAAVGLLVPLLATILVVGATSFDLTGYGGRRELEIALAILLLSLLLFAYRRVVQDRAPLRLRERP
jgi:amino acid transporter